MRLVGLLDFWRGVEMMRCWDGRGGMLGWEDGELFEVVRGRGLWG